MELEIKTLTPLWTGGVEAGTVNRIQETGVVGSLRWWFEVFVRGLGGRVNDPTQDERSGLDPDKYKKSTATDERARLRDAGLCDVSQVFGATGWRRRFRLTIVDQTQQDTQSPKKISAARVNTKTDRKATWWFPHPPRSGDLTLQIQGLAQDFPPDVITGLIQFIADWAALGARAQMGFGVIEPVNGRIDTRLLYDWLIATTGSYHYPQLPSLQNLFLARLQRGNAIDRHTFDLKYDLRQLFRQDRDLRHFIMGTVQGERTAAKVKISRAYGAGLMRVWGWIPEESDTYQGSWNRDAIVEAIHRHLKTNYSLQLWREMNSDRDTVAPGTNDARAFLRSLLGLEDENAA